VGGSTLVNLLKGMRYHGVVAACGLAGGATFQGTVFPFILRGVRLIGIDSAYFPADRRPAVWARLARDLDLGLLARMTRTISLDEVPAIAPDFLAGRVQGRVVVDIRA
jgi:acrylyl-CoA reductase (NADPH)